MIYSSCCINKIFSHCTYIHSYSRSLSPRSISLYYDTSERTKSSFMQLYCCLTVALLSPSTTPPTRPSPLSTSPPSPVPFLRQRITIRGTFLSRFAQPTHLNTLNKDEAHDLNRSSASAAHEQRSNTSAHSDNANYLFYWFDAHSHSAQGCAYTNKSCHT